jgi:hypothetical protein
MTEDGVRRKTMPYGRERYIFNPPGIMSCQKRSPYMLSLIYMFFPKKKTSPEWIRTTDLSIRYPKGTGVTVERVSRLRHRGLIRPKINFKYIS